jgi:putative flippase GtrA
VSAIASDRPIHSQLFFRFCVVGAIAFVVDAGAVQALVGWRDWDPFLARVVSYLAAATTAWWLNRRFTFGAGDAPIHREWASYLVVNTAGGLVNYATYAVLVLAVDTVRLVPALGVAAGSVAGLAVNFALNRWLVFRRRGP